MIYFIMNKITVAVVVLILVGFGALVAWSSLNSTAVDYGSYDTSKIIAADDHNGNISDHVRGKADSPVVVVEYADLQCSGCATSMPKITELYEEYGDRVAFVYRNFPLSGHQNARAASAAAESAGFQGYYWEMMETLYSNRAVWISLTGSTRSEKFTELFQQIAPEGDTEAFNSGMTDARVEAKINFDYAIGSKVQKVNQTPSFFVNGVNVDFSQAQTQDQLKSLIEDKINEELKSSGLETGKKK